MDWEELTWEGAAAVVAVIFLAGMLFVAYYDYVVTSRESSQAIAGQAVFAVVLLAVLAWAIYQQMHGPKVSGRGSVW
ncbi:MAG: hypothetical protein JRM99_04245 [Nitrososphaerota archaeon]|nr:hypothetical protein [Nitrososphaerota archaeon]